MSFDWGVIAGGAIVSFCLVPLMRMYALRNGLVDEPGPRRSHRVSTPRGGGAAMVIALAIMLWLLPLPSGWLLAILPALALVALLGFADDHQPLAVRWRLLIQFLACAWVLAWLGGVRQVGIAGVEVFTPWLWSPLALFALVWLVNLYNFMDGADGLAAGQGLMTSLLFAVAFHANAEPAGFWLALAVAAVCLGFLPWNLPWNLVSRRIFMGDVGSLALGLMIGVLALVGAVTGTVSVWLSLLLASVFGVDATATLVRQVCSGQRWYTAHRQHAYQRLIASGWSHRAVLAGCVLVNVGVVLPAGLLVLRYPQLDMVLSLSTCGLLLLGWFRIRRHTE